MKIYVGIRETRPDTSGGCRVIVDDGGAMRPLDPRFDLRTHSPDGFNWGYGGSGPAQLALAILADLYGPAVAMVHYHRFKFAVIAALDQSQGFSLEEPEIRAVVDPLRAGEDLEREERLSQCLYCDAPATRYRRGEGFCDSCHREQIEEE